MDGQRNKYRRLNFNKIKFSDKILSTDEALKAVAPFELAIEKNGRNRR